MEATVSYGGGTAAGPDAILQASLQVELYDRAFDCEAVHAYGVHTLASLELDGDPRVALQDLEDRVAALPLASRKLGVLGGEHTLTQGVVKGLLRAGQGPLTVVTVDAHADLRDTYEDTPFSHACVCRRLLELPQVEQILMLGVRSVCPEEIDVIRAEKERVRVWFSEEVHAGGWQDELRNRLRGRQVYLSLDVDGFDPSVIAATGTPEPDGLSWRQGQELLKLVASTAEIVAFDCVELAPVPALHAADFAVAKLVYTVLNQAFARDIRESKTTTRRESER